MSPSVLAVPCVIDSTVGSIIEKLYAHPSILDSGSEWYAFSVSYDYHMSNDRRIIEAGGRIPLIEGKSIKAFEVAPAGMVEKSVGARRQSEPDGRYRIGCGAVAGTLLARRMGCTLLPRGYATGNSINTFLLEGNDAERLFLIAVLNSLVVEWRVRQIARNNNINKFMLAQLPIPRPPRANVESVGALAAALVMTDARFKDLRPLLNGFKPADGAAERHDLKCRIDAEVAHLFRLNEEELSRILEAFDKVPSATKDLVRAHFKTL